MPTYPSRSRKNNHPFTGLFIILLVASSTICYGQLPQTMETSQQIYGESTPHTQQGQTGIATFFQPEGTRGSKFFSATWLNGTVEYANNPVISGIGYVYNFDKISNEILTTKDNVEILKIPSEDVIRFTLIDSGRSITFEKVPQISTRFFLVPLVSDADGYSLYMRITTHYSPTDASAVESGGAPEKNYDSYLDAYTYYIIPPGNAKFKTCTLTQQSIKKALPDNATETQDFFNKHPEKITPNMLVGLIDYLNVKKTPLAQNHQTGGL